MDKLQKFVDANDDKDSHDNEDPRDKDQHVNDDDKNLHDIKENIESYELHDNMDLPTKWNINDKSDSLSVSSDGLEVEYTGGNYKILLFS
jgi:hypothetical protein